MIFKKSKIQLAQKFAAAACSIFFLAQFFCGCQDVIYENIRKEVKLKDGTISGSIRSIVRFNCEGKEYYYLSNGGSIYRKDAESKQTYGGWKNVSPALSGLIVDIAADENFLYAFVATWEENTQKGQNRWNGRHIFCSEDGKKWKKIEDVKIYTSSNGTGSDNPEVYIFCTNSIEKSNRKAYCNYDERKIYELNGASATELSLLSDKDENAKTTPTVKTKSCAFFEGATYFFNGFAACTNERYCYVSEDGEKKDEQEFDEEENPLLEKQIEAADACYFSKGSSVFRLSGGSGTDEARTGGTVYSIGITRDFLLAGTSSGIEHYSIKADGGLGSKADFSTNADAIMTSAYDVNAILVANPELKEKDTAIYSAIDFEGRNQQYDHVCLWAYYPSRGNWNRD